MSLTEKAHSASTPWPVRRLVRQQKAPSSYLKTTSNAYLLSKLTFPGAPIFGHQSPFESVQAIFIWLAKFAKEDRHRPGLKLVCTEEQSGWAWMSENEMSQNLSP
jgi:hypothetical protein